VSVSQFDLLAASLRADAVDLKAFVEALAVKLNVSFPQRVRVERKGGRFGGTPHVHRVAVTLGDNEYELRNEDGQIACQRRNVVRGIALKTEQLSLEQWIDALAGGLVDEAGKTESDRVALERMLSD
jgi:hypothetical protein